MRKEEFDGLGFYPADILLPQNCDLSRWSVVACDQYTSQPDYWKRVEDYVGEHPSTLGMILPESHLGGPDVEARIARINSTMNRYLQQGRFVCHPQSLLYVERTLRNGDIRRGLVGMVDLEQYQYEPGNGALIRATEGTVRVVVLRLCHCLRVSLASELSSRAACSSWKFFIRERAP